MSLLSDLGVDFLHYFSFSRGEAKHIPAIIEGMIDKRTVNLAEIANNFTHVNGTAKTRYRRLQDFFSKSQLINDEYIRFIVAMLFEEDELLTLAIDRTEWGFGKKWHNLLIISVIYKGSAVPLAIMPLERKGNSNTRQRLDLMDQILRIVPCYRIKMILGDREFIGDQWFNGLENRLVSFVMRVRDNITVFPIMPNGKLQKISELPDNFEGKVQIGSAIFNLSKKKLSKENVLCVISMMVRKPLEAYRQRWKIETGFLALKTNGFNLETTHLSDGKKLKFLTQIASIAIVLSLKTAEIIQPKETSLKKNTDFQQSLSLKQVIAS